MKIIDWNCHGDFRTKRNIILERYPDWDILVIQECEYPNLPPYNENNKENEENKKKFAQWAEKWSKNYWAKTDYKNYFRWSKDHHCIWKGYNPNKGVAVFSKRDEVIKLNWPNKFPGEKKFNYIINKPDPFETTELLYFLPVEIDGYVLIAVNTKEVKNISGKTSYIRMADYKYTGLITEYLKLNKNQMVNRDVIFIGDFNDNIKLCKMPKDRKRFGNMIEEFKNIGLTSLYHTKHKINILNCEEKQPTCYDHEKGNHIDYCFVSKRFQNSDIEITRTIESDHCLLAITV
jgi:endonuclease/exonuclease/phosphatase family metal-dependent hydrolase